MSCPQSYPQGYVDKATHRTQCLTDSRDPSLYLKDNLSENKRKIKINKKQIKIKTTNTYKSVIVLSIIILTITSTSSAKAVSQTDLLKLYAHSRIICAALAYRYYMIDCCCIFCSAILATIAITNKDPFPYL